MKTVLVTGAKGFIGKNLIAALGRKKDLVIKTFDVEDGPSALEAYLMEADFVYHFAGVNRPQNPEEFKTGNADTTASIVALLEKSGRKVPILLTSSIQAERDNPYGVSKKAAEEILADYNKRTGAPVFIYRLPGVFGKWSRPNYNTVVATFCHNIARGLDIKISDPGNELELVYIDDIVNAFLRHLDEDPEPGRHRYQVERTFRVTLGELAEKIRRLHDIRQSLMLPDLSDDFTKCLHATYLSFLPEDDFSYPVKLNTDNRGWLFELVKSAHFGQIFVSKTLPGITRGNHYHDTKLEKFCVVQGEGVIRFRRIDYAEVLEYPVNGDEIKVVDIPPGYTHSIENTGDSEMIVLFWANQIFNPDEPDTYFTPVIKQG